MSIKALIKKRGTIKRKFTLFVKFFESLGDVPTSTKTSELKERFHNFQALMKQFSQYQDEIDCLVEEVS